MKEINYEATITIKSKSKVIHENDLHELETVLNEIGAEGFKTEMNESIKSMIIDNLSDPDTSVTVEDSTMIINEVE